MLLAETDHGPLDLGPLVDALTARPLVVLAGAGCSTESGIPDYRGPDGRQRVRAPVQYGEFVRSAESRARYWSRSAVGWGRMATARPNAAHRALARLEDAGVVRGVITQNVDGLHHAAGSRRVIELHGSLAHVRCLGCDQRIPRDDFQASLLSENPGWLERVGARDARPTAAPDGDADLSADMHTTFRVPDCPRCGGVLKPDVVFFGESVPRSRVDDAWSLLEQARALLVVGSSLAVYSGRRFIYRAVERDVPIAIVNVGPTRADDVARAKVEGRLGAVLPSLADALLGQPPM